MYTVEYEEQSQANLFSISSFPTSSILPGYAGISTRQHAKGAVHQFYVGVGMLFFTYSADFLFPHAFSLKFVFNVEAIRPSIYQPSGNVCR